MMPFIGIAVFIAFLGLSYMGILVGKMYTRQKRMFDALRELHGILLGLNRNMEFVGRRYDSLKKNFSNLIEGEERLRNG